MLFCGSGCASTRVIARGSICASLHAVFLGCRFCTLCVLLITPRHCFTCMKIPHLDGVQYSSTTTLACGHQINVIGEPFLNINCHHLKDFDEDLYRQLAHYPQEVIPTFDMAVNQLFFNRFPEAALEHQIQVRPYNMDKTSNMRSLNPEGQ